MEILLGIILFIVIYIVIGTSIEKIIDKAKINRRAEKEKQAKKEKEDLKPLAEVKAKELLTKFDSNPILHKIEEKFVSRINSCIVQHDYNFTIELTADNISLSYHGYPYKDCFFFSDYNLKPLNSISERATIIYLIGCHIRKSCKCFVSFSVKFKYSKLNKDNYITTEETHHSLNTNEEFTDFLISYILAEKKGKAVIQKWSQYSIDSLMHIEEVYFFVKEKEGENEW